MVGNGLRSAAVEQAKVFVSQAEATEQVVDYKYVEDHLPLYMDYKSEPLWNTYSKFGARRLLAECFYRPFLKEVGLE